MPNSQSISVNFNLRSVEAEAESKVLTMTQFSDEPELQLLELCSQRLSKSDANKVVATISFAKSLKSTNASHPSMRAYLSHPLRVAKLALQLLDSPSAEIVSMGVLHNVFEISGMTEAELVSHGYSARVAVGIRLMTVDRKRQADDAYLTDFYRRIEDFGTDLALVKSVDKLDNLLAFRLIDGPIREEYLEKTDRFVTPMAGRLSVDFGKYFEEVVKYMRAVGCDPKLKAEYDAFRQQSADE